MRKPEDHPIDKKDEQFKHCMQVLLPLKRFE